MQRLGSRVSNSQLREPGFESCAAVLNVGQDFHSTLLQYTQRYENEYLALNSGGYLSSLHTLIAEGLGDFERS